MVDEQNQVPRMPEPPRPPRIRLDLDLLKLTDDDIEAIAKQHADETRIGLRHAREIARIRARQASET